MPLNAYIYMKGFQLSLTPTLTLPHQGGGDLPFFP
jgi:hypothetical protein